MSPHTPAPAATDSQRFVVLGGTGLIGSSVVSALVEVGHEVVVLARHAPNERIAPLLEGASVVIGSAGDPATLRHALDGADHVIDALGAPHPADSADAPLAQFDAEVPVLLGVLDELREHPGARFTYLSSGGAIYGNVAALPVEEGVECHPVSPYGVTKLAAERYVLLAAHTNGLAVRILRVSNAYGALQRPRTGQGIVAVLLHAAATGDTVRVFGDGSAVRDYVEVRDVAHAVVGLAAQLDGSPIVNVGSGTGHRLLDVLAVVESTTGRKIPVDYAAPRSSDVTAVVLDVTRLSRLVAWHPMSLERGVAETWEAWQRWGLDRAEPSAELR